MVSSGLSQSKDLRIAKLVLARKAVQHVSAGFLPGKPAEPSFEPQRGLHEGPSLAPADSEQALRGLVGWQRHARAGASLHVRCSMLLGGISSSFTAC